MDNQFNSLIQSYNTNYVQYKVTGNSSYQNGYSSAQEALDSIIADLQKTVDDQKNTISEFYKSGVEEKLNKLQANNRKLQRGILFENDNIAAAQTRNQPGFIPIGSTSQYIAIGILAAATIGLSFL
jgi:flagellar biosynthesis chaperone FliJ